MSLKLLDDSVRSYIRTGVAISCISQSVEELVLNSLDAGARCVTVHIHIPNLCIQVSDNGTGISYDDLQCIGKRYTTSKCHSLQDLDGLCYHGYRGEALASITSCCGVVEITSKHCLSSSAYCKIFHNGNNLGVCPAKGTVGIGTTVTIRDIFYNMPVRKKIICSSTECDRIRRMLMAIALIHPDVSFTLHNDETLDKPLHTRRTDSILRNFEQLFGIPLASSLREVSAKKDLFQISGYVSTKGYYTKSYQFVYLNKRHIKNTRLHKHVNDLLSNSLVTRKSLPTKPNSVLEHQTPHAECHGVFVLNIECPVTEYDICLEPAKTLVEFIQWNVVLDAVKEAVTEFLVRNHLMIGISSLVEEACTSGTSSMSPRLPLHNNVGPVQKVHTEPPAHVHTIQDPEPSHGNVDMKLTHSNSVRYGIHSRPAHRPRSISTSSSYNDIGRSSIAQSSNDHSQSARDELLPPTNKRKKTVSDGDSSLSQSNSGNRVKMIGLNRPMRSPLGGRFTSIAKKLNEQLAQQRKRSSTSLIDTSRVQQQSRNMEEQQKQFTVNDSNQTGLGVASNILQDSMDNNTTLIHDSCVTVPTQYTATDQKDDRCITTEDSQLMNVSINGSTRQDIQPIHATSTQTPDHSRLMNVCTTQTTSNPTEKHKSHRCSSFVDLRSQATNVTNSSIETVNSSNATPNSMSYLNVYKPSLRAAPHLSYGYSSLMPRPKESRKFNFNSVNTSSSVRVDLPESKWRNSQCPWEDGGVSLSSILSDWTNPAFACGGNDIVNVGLSSEKSSSIKIHSIINPYKFTNAIFDSIEVLGQIDQKFIACLVKIKATDSKFHRLLVFFDQHAVHERVRVEALIKDSYTPDGTLSSVKVDPPRVISLTDTEQRLALITYKKQLIDIGVSLSMDGNGHVLVHSMPSAFCEKDLSGKRKGRSTVAIDLVQELVTRQLDLLSSTCSACSVVPSVILNVLNSRACHGAIKFGDPLTNAECSELIHSLSKCNLPFQCAHGRPSVIPILDLDMLEKRYPSSVGQQCGSIDIGKLKKLCARSN